MAFPSESYGNEGGEGSNGSPSLTSSANDSSMMPPPTPGSVIRSSGRMVKPTLKVRVGHGENDESDDDASNAGGPSSGLRRSGMRSASGMPGKVSMAQKIRARRLRLNINREQRIRGRGDPTYAGAKKTIPYMQGYDRELDSSDDETGEGMAFEEQIILRMPEGNEYTKKLSEWVRRREAGTEGHEIELKFKDSRRAVFKVGDKMFSSKLVDLPAIVESHKTLDNKQMFKICDISQMLLVTHPIDEEADVTKPNPEPIEGLADDFVYDHGITPPMRWARKRRFRKRIHKRTIETVENEVERLLAEDERAERLEYRMVDAAEADLSDSDDDGEGGRRRRGGRDSFMDDGTSTIADGDDRSLIDDFEEGSFMADEEDVDRDLQRELEEEMLLQQQEDEEDDDDEDDEEDDDGSSAGGGRRRRRARSTSRATSDDDDDEDEDEDDDLFDAGEDDEPRTDAEQEAKAGDEDQEDDDDDDLDEEEKELRVREQQLEAECREIEGMVKRKQAELEGTANALIKQRNQASLKRIQAELDMKRSQLQDLKQERRDGKAAAKAEAQAQAEEQAAALAAEASTTDAAASGAAAASSSSAAAVAGSAASGMGSSTIEEGKRTSADSAAQTGGLTASASHDSGHEKRTAKSSGGSSNPSSMRKGGSSVAASAASSKKTVRTQDAMDVEDAEARANEEDDDEGDVDENEEDVDEDDDDDGSDLF